MTDATYADGEDTVGQEQLDQIPDLDAGATASVGLFQRALRVTPGGVNSPVRAFRSVGGTPRFMVSGKGAEITDADGNSYVDLVGSWGPMILGHSHPAVIDAVTAAVSRGLSFGTPGRGEVLLAEEIVARVPAVEQVRLVSSGTEATMSAIRLARGFTGRSKIIKFAGCYHGHVDALLASAVSGVATFALPDSAGVTAATTAEVIVAPRPDVMKRGVPPTDRNARTGEFTPPGVTSSALANRAALASSRITGLLRTTAWWRSRSPSR